MAAAHLPAADYGPGSGRFGAIVAAVVGLISVAIGGLTLARSSRTGQPGHGAGSVPVPKSGERMRSRHRPWDASS